VNERRSLTLEFSWPRDIFSAREAQELKICVILISTLAPGRPCKLGDVAARSNFGACITPLFCLAV
jgi:hypothetical protein